MPDTVDILSSSLASTFRVWAGVNSSPAASKPEQLLQLYDMENSPHCRLVREALTELDLDAEIYPCPKGGKRFRPYVVDRGGKAQFPFLIDPNSGQQMYESLNIVAYLYDKYGQRKLPFKWRTGQLQTMSSILASASRSFSSSTPRPSIVPLRPLELYSFEASPYARPIRELLCRLELPYILRSCGRSRVEEWLLPRMREKLSIVPASELQNRKSLQSKEGKVSIPYLYDVNTNTGLFESDDITDYLETQYTL